MKPIPMFSEEWNRFYGEYIGWYCYASKTPYIDWPAGKVYLYRVLMRLRSSHYSSLGDTNADAQELVCAVWHELINEHCVQEVLYPFNTNA